MRGGSHEPPGDRAFARTRGKRRRRRQGSTPQQSLQTRRITSDRWIDRRPANRLESLRDERVTAPRRGRREGTEGTATELPVGKAVPRRLESQPDCSRSRCNRRLRGRNPPPGYSVTTAFVRKLLRFPAGKRTMHRPGPFAPLNSQSLPTVERHFGERLAYRVLMSSLPAPAPDG